MDLNIITTRMRDYFIHRQDVCTAYLFGSLVKGKCRRHSDVDVAVLFSSGMSVIDRFERKLEVAVELEDLLSLPVDVVDLESADPYFIHQVMLNKILVVDKDVNRRVGFEVRSRKVFFDRKHFYDLYHSQALRRLEGTN